MTGLKFNMSARNLLAPTGWVSVLCHILLMVFLSLALASQAGAETSRYKREGKQCSITIYANVKEAAVMENGLFLGNAGATFDGSPGIHELTISALGYVPRLALIRVESSHPHVSLNVKLVPVPDKNTDIDLDFGQANSFPKIADFAKLPSLCATYNASGVKLPSDRMLTCQRQTILDDLAYFGTDGIVARPIAGVQLPPPGDKIRTALLTQLPRAANEDFYWTAEELFAMAPDDEVAADLLAYSALRRGQCPRVMQVAMETGAMRRPNPGLLMIRGFCLELANQPEKAAKLYLNAMAGPSTKVDTYYHVARALGVTAVDSAEKSLKTCIAALPHYYPCYEALAQLRAASHRTPAALQALSAYHRQMAAVLAVLIPKDAKTLNAGKIAEAFALRPWSFELLLGVAASSQDSAAIKQAATLASGTLISDIERVKILLPSIEGLHHPELSVIAEAVLAKVSPTTVSYWIKLTNGYRSLGRCSEAMAAADRAIALLESSDRRNAVIISKTSCLVSLGKLEEAEKLLLVIVNGSPGHWQAHYNLGVIQERLGKVDAGLENLQIALSGDMPADVRAKLERLLVYYESKKTPKPAVATP